MQRVGFVVSPGFQVMSFAALAAFEFANSSVEKPFYDVRVLSEAGGRVPSSLGLAIETRRFGSSIFDTLIVSGSIDIVPASRGVLAFVRKAAKRSRRVASICTGAFILAEAGLLDGRRATTHWCAARDLRERYPNVNVDEDRIFIVDAPIWTSAGASVPPHLRAAAPPGPAQASPILTNFRGRRRIPPPQGRATARQSKAVAKRLISSVQKEWGASS